MENLENVGSKQQLPNAVAVLVLGICSILFGCFFVGLICGIIGVVMSSKGKQMYQTNPSAYDNYGMLNAGRIMSIIGIVFGALYVLYYIIFVALIGTAASGIGLGSILDLID